MTAAEKAPSYGPPIPDTSDPAFWERATRMTVRRGDQFYCTLPPWINEGRTVIVTVTKVLRPFGRDSYNGHDVMGNWTDKDGNAKRGKFYLKDLTPV